MLITICDDNAAFADWLAARIHTMVKCETRVFYSIAALKFALDDIGGQIDALFMDIMNKDGNGIDAVIDITEKFPLIKTVYITGHGIEYSQAIFNCPPSANPVAFLTKPVEDRYLAAALDKLTLYRKPKDDDSKIIARQGGKTIFFPVNDILYITSEGRKVYLETISGSFSFYARLDEVVAQCPSLLCKCHKSYAVNLTRILSIDGWRTVTMFGGKQFPISRNCAPHFKQALLSRRAKDSEAENRVFNESTEDL